jgi:hypothetical protein
LQILNHSVTNITDSALPSIRASDDIQLSFERLNTLIYRGLNTVDDKEWNSIQIGIDQQRVVLNQSVEAYGKLASGSEDKRLHQQLKRHLDNYLTQFDLTLRAAKTGDQSTAAHFAGTELQQAVQQMQGSLAALLKRSLTTAKTSQTEADDAYSHTVTGVVITIVTATAVLIAVSLCCRAAFWGLLKCCTAR